MQPFASLTSSLAQPTQESVKAKEPPAGYAVGSVTWAKSPRAVARELFHTQTRRVRIAWIASGSGGAYRCARPREGTRALSAGAWGRATPRPNAA